MIVAVANKKWQSGLAQSTHDIMTLVMKQRPIPSIVSPESIYPPDFLEWMALSPAQRVVQNQKLWDIFLAYGGSLDVEPDPQSPFFDPEAPASGPAHGGAGLRIVRRC